MKALPLLEAIATSQISGQTEKPPRRASRQWRHPQPKTVQSILADDPEFHQAQLVEETLRDDLDAEPIATVT